MFSRFITILFVFILSMSGSFATDTPKHRLKVFICPMHSHIKSHQAGSCPICGMDLLLNKKKPVDKISITLSNTIKNTLHILSENVRRIDLKTETYSGYKLQQLAIPETEFSIRLLKPQLADLKVGNLVEAEAKDYVWGKRTWLGTVTKITEEHHNSAQNYSVNILLKTPYGILKPNMYINLTLYGTAHSALVIPFKSVFFSPKQQYSVVKVIAKNRYQNVPITLGRRQDHLVEVLEGLNENDKVVVEGQFLLRSEQQLNLSNEATP